MTVVGRAASFLSVKPGEGRSVVLMVLHSVAMGTSTVFFETAASALFLARFPSGLLPWVYIVAAVVNTLTGFAYSRLQVRLSFRGLMLTTVSFLLVCAVGLRAGLALTGAASLVFGLLVFYRILSALTDLEYWAVATRLYDVRQAKRLFGLVGSGEVVARIAGSFSVPLLVRALGVANLIVLSAAGLGGLPLWAVGLLAAGGMSAAFSTTAGLMMTGSASFSFDIYPRLIRPYASERDKVYAAKAFFLILAAVVMVLTFQPWGMIAEIAAFAFAVAGNTIFPAFLLGIWWPRANAAGAICGMLTGLSISFAPLLAGDRLPFIAQLFPLTSSAFIGAPLVLIVMIGTSLLTAPPSAAIRLFVSRDVHDCPDN